MDIDKRIQAFGKKLVAKLKEGASPQEIGLWTSDHAADFCYLPSMEEEAQDAYRIIIDLMTMSEGPEYALSQEELLILAHYLMYYKAQEVCKVTVGWKLDGLIRQGSIEDIASVASAIRFAENL